MKICLQISAFYEIRTTKSSLEYKFAAASNNKQKFLKDISKISIIQKFWKFCALNSIKYDDMKGRFPEAEN